MKTIETTATIAPDGILTVHVPPDVPPGEHRVVIVIEQPPAGSARRPPLDLPVHDVGPWPEDLSLRREELYDGWGAEKW